MALKIRTWIYDVANGLWSGIPWCCIMEFASWAWYAGNITVARDLDAVYGEDPLGIEYVRCGACRKIDRRADVNMENGRVLEWIL